MRNYIQPGDVLTLTATDDVASGEGMLFNSLFGVATADVKSGEKGEFQVTGVVDLPKTSAQAWAEGVKVYWDDSALECTTTATDNVLIGCATQAAANPSTTGRVRLNGSVA